MKIKKEIKSLLFLVLLIVLYSYLPNGIIIEKIDGAGALESSRVISSSGYSTARVCTQNLFRLGDRGLESTFYKEQIAYLVERIVEARCSVVALQEVAGNNKQSREILSRLTELLNSNFSGAKFNFLIGDSNDKYIRNAYIYNSSAVKLLSKKSLYHDSLPRLSFRSAPWSYVRGPLIAEFSLQEVGNQKKLVLINYHLKSKSRGYKDKTGLDFELSRVISAAGIREEIDAFMKSQSQDYVEILLGDRNADSESATASIFSGILDLDDFRGSQPCEIERSGEASCEMDHYTKASFIEVLASKNLQESTKLYTHQYRGRGSILDEIYVSAEDFSRIESSDNKQIKAGVVGEFKKGSDHLLSWVEVSLE